jgi:hypothetical protein
VAVVVGVHGIGQQYSGRELLESEWGPALRSGLSLVGAPELKPGDFHCAFYGDIFRPQGKSSSVESWIGVDDIQPGLESDLLLALAGNNNWPPNLQTKARYPLVLQRAISHLLQTPFFSGVSEKLMLLNLRQLTRYFQDEEIRDAARQRVKDMISSETRVIIGHSLGTVVAYEVLSQLTESKVELLLTLGSPLGISPVIFDRLSPPPSQGRGIWPIGASRWTNVSDLHDIVALVKSLGPQFGAVSDYLVSNGAKAHSVSPYLTARETGEAVSQALLATYE